MTQAEFLHQIADYLDAARIPYMLAGSYGSGVHGQPRATNDVDLVVEPSAAQLDSFVALVGERYYVSPESAREALAQRLMFNVIDFDNGWKADLIVRKDRPFSVEEFRRRKMDSIHGRVIPVVSAEDVILSKLEWNKFTRSERQVADALNVAVLQGRRLDLAYLRKWAVELGVSAELEELLRQAGLAVNG